MEDHINDLQDSVICADGDFINGIDKISLILSLVSLLMWWIAPTSFVLSCIGRTYFRTVEAKIGILCSSISLLILVFKCISRVY